MTDHEVVNIAVQSILLAGHWMLGETIAFTHSLFNMIPQLLQS